MLTIRSLPILCSSMLYAIHTFFAITIYSATHINSFGKVHLGLSGMKNDTHHLGDLSAIIFLILNFVQFSFGHTC